MKNDFSRLPEPEAASSVTAGGTKEQDRVPLPLAVLFLFCKVLLGSWCRHILFSDFFQEACSPRPCVLENKEHKFLIKNNLIGCLLGVLITEV